MMRACYFGGYRSTHDDVVSWKHSAQKKRPDIDWMVYHYPEHASAGNPLEYWKSSDYVAHELKPEWIIGHSSGCAIANRVAAECLKLGAKFNLVALEGFAPSRSLLLLPETQVWSAESRGIRARNYYGLRGTGDRFHVWQANVVRPWPLHFSVVNLNVSDLHDDLTEGYRYLKNGSWVECDANLCWLTEPVVARSAAA